MSVQSDIRAFMDSIAKGTPNGEYVAITPEEIANQTGFSREKVNKTLYNLMVTKKAELIRGENGRAIIGFRLLPPPEDGRKRRGPRNNIVQVPPTRLDFPSVPTTEEHRNSVRRLYGRSTPALDDYSRAKNRFEAMKAELGSFIEASFNEDPMAEEGLILKRELDALRPRIGELERENRELRQELQAIKGRKRAELTQSAIESGAMAIHSSD